MEQVRKLIECDDCDNAAIITPLSDEDLIFCPFCGSKLEQKDKDDLVL